MTVPIDQVASERRPLWTRFVRGCFSGMGFAIGITVGIIAAIALGDLLVGPALRRISGLDQGEPILASDAQLVIETTEPMTITRSPGASVTLKNSGKHALTVDTMELRIWHGQQLLVSCRDHNLWIKQMAAGDRASTTILCDEADRTALPPDARYEVLITKVFRRG